MGSPLEHHNGRYLFSLSDIDPFGRAKPLLCRLSKRARLRVNPCLLMGAYRQAPRPEPFDRLKALSSIEGLGSKASLGL